MQIKLHRQVDGSDVFGQCADRDVINPRLGNRTDIIQRDAARSFQRDVRRDIVAQLYGRSQSVGREIIQQQAVRPGFERLAGLVERLDLDFDEYVCTQSWLRFRAFCEYRRPMRCDFP